MYKYISRVVPMVCCVQFPCFDLFIRLALLPVDPVPSPPSPASNSSTNIHLQLLENQLKKASAEERKTGIDLSGLRAQIKKEIAEVDKRL